VGGLNYRATGGSGDLHVGGQVTGSDRVMIGTSNGSIHIGDTAYVATLDAGSELDVEAGVYEGGMGSVIVDGMVDSAGIAYLSTASGGEGSGNIEIGKSGMVSAAGNAYLRAGHGSVVYGTYSLLESFGSVIVDGNVQAANIEADAGFNMGFGEILGLGLGGSKVQVGTSGSMVAASDVSVSGVDGVKHDGVIAAGDNVSVRAYVGVNGSGDINVSGGDIGVSGMFGSVSLAGAVKARNASFVAQNGFVSAQNEANDFTGLVSASGGSNVTIVDANSLTVGSVSAGGGDVRLLANGGDLAVRGSVVAPGDVRISTIDGNLTVASGADVRSTGPDGKVTLASTENESVSCICIDGRVSSEGDNGSVVVQMVPNETANGTLTIGK